MNALALAQPGLRTSSSLPNSTCRPRNTANSTITPTTVITTSRIPDPQPRRHRDPVRLRGPKVDEGPFASYLVDVSYQLKPSGLIKSLKTLLRDTYPDTGDGRTPVREIVQNADDAKAKRLVFAALDRGTSNACNTLLSGPALLVANDGPFSDQDKDAMHQTSGGSKTGDSEKIGRFGMGLKSVFHLCEAFVYLGAERGTTKPGVLNPWAGTGDVRNRDQLHPDWDTVHNHDRQLLLAAAKALLDPFDDGLLLWIPLRLRKHFNRAPNGGDSGLVKVYPTIEKIKRWFEQPASLALLLAQCGHLHCIKAVRAKNLDQLKNPRCLVRFARPDFNSRKWVGRPGRDSDQPNGDFQGSIDDGGAGAGWSVIGVDTLGRDSLSHLTSDSNWPTDDEPQGGGVFSPVPQKALAHAAVTVLHRQDSNLPGVRIRWAVFLPLDDAPQPADSEIVDTVGVGIGSDSWDIIIHGYFWPSENRRSIPGATNNDNGGDADETRMRALWNRTLRDEILLPLLPQVIARAAQTPTVSVEAAMKLVKDVADSKTVRSHPTSVTSSHALLPVITAAGIQWQAVTADACVLEVPAWMDAPDSVREAFGLKTTRKGLIFIAKDAPRIGGNPRPWLVDHIKLLLSCVSCGALQTPESLDWTAKLVSYVLGQHGAGDGRYDAVASWLARRVAEGALATATDRANSRRTALRRAWLRLYAKLPEAWLIDTHEDSMTAVAELANDGKLGAGLLPIPLPRRNNEDPRGPSSKPDQRRLDEALRSLGKGLTEPEDDMQRSRLLLAEDLLSVRDDRGLDNLADLSLLRVRRFPNSQVQRPDRRRRAEAWSANRLRLEIARRRVFRDAGSIKAVGELAEALGEPVWLVDCVPAAFPKVPPATPGALAKAVLAHTIRSSPAQRIPLLRRLASDDADDTRRALRVLLTGKSSAAGEARDRDLYCVRENDRQRIANRKTLNIILRLLDEEWRELSPDFNAFIAQNLTPNLGESLQVKNVDRHVLQDMLRETLDATDANDWRCGKLQRNEVLHLLRELHGLTGWEKMPLHRCVDRMRRCFANRTVVADRLPPELEGEEIRLLSPDKEVACLYRHLRLNRDGKLRLMLLADRPHRFVCAILSELSQDTIGERQVTLPDSPELREFLLTKSWLPTCDREPGLAPEKLIDLSEDMLSTVRPLANALGNYRLPDAVSPRIWDSAKEIVHEVLGCPDLLQRFAKHLNTGLVSGVDRGVYLILPCGIEVDHNLIRDALKTPLKCNPGWKIVQAAKATAGRVDSAVVSLARTLCGRVPARLQVEALNALTDTRYSMDTPAGKMYGLLLHSFAKAEGFDEAVLPKIKVPTQDGDWCSPDEVTSSTFGIASCHRIAEELRDIRCFQHAPRTLVEEESVRWFNEPDRSKTANFMLCRYFEKWEGCLSNSAVGAFLSLLGNNQSHARRWLETVGVDVSTVRRSLPINDYPNVIVHGVAKNTYAINLLGKMVEMKTDGNNQIFATEPYPSPRLDHGKFWEVSLRCVNPETSSRNDLVLLLRKAVEWWAVKVLGLDLSTVQNWWRNWETGSQAQVARVRTSIMAHLPLTLRQLGVHDCELLQISLTNAERAQREREQAAPLQEPLPNAERWQQEREQAEALAKERRMLQLLEKLVEDPGHSTFLRKRVRKAIERSGYTAGSVLLELIQNADDALVQAVEIARKPLPTAAGRVRIRVHGVNGTRTVELIHFGRPINEPGGSMLPDNLDGRQHRREDGLRRQWDNDLYFMMLLNLTAKPGETPQENVRPTTGRFGLGFKSVHLISDNPFVVSKDIAFKISAGLLPVDQRVPRAGDPDLAPIDGHPATRIQLPLRTDVRDILERAFARFHPISALLPAFARKVHTVVVEGDERYAGKGTFDGDPIVNAPGWSINKEMTKLPGGTWRLLRFRPCPGTAALVVGLQGGVPTRLPPEVPFLWNVAPTDEWPGCGYAVNGPFKLDPGRTHASLNHQETLDVAVQLGVELGKGLVALHKALASNEDSTYNLPVGSEKVAHFMAALWKVFTSGIDDRDDLRREFCQRLHSSGRGISKWLSVCGRHSMAQANPEPEEGSRPPPEPPINEVSQLARVPSSVWLSSHFFHKFQRWWDDKAVQTKVIEKYEKDAWPDWLRREDRIADGLRKGSPDHWLALFVLGSCRRLGQKRAFQHRGFLEWAHTNGWWDVFMKPDSTNEWMEKLRIWQDDQVSEHKYENWMSLFPTIYKYSRYLCTYRRLLLGAGQRERLNVGVLLEPRVDSALSNAGTSSFDAPPALLGMGLHWVLRELVRLKIVEDDRLLPYCWVPSGEVLKFLERLGYKARLSESPNSKKAGSVSAFMKDKMNTENWHLDHSFDIPLRHVASDEDLQRRLGLAT